MVYRAMPQRSATYGSLVQARPSRYGLAFTDRVAACPDCGRLRRIDVNDIFYSHGEAVGAYGEWEWILCPGTGRALPTRAPATPPAPELSPGALRRDARTQLSANEADIARLEQLIARREEFIRTTPFGHDGQYVKMKEHRLAINRMLAENEFFTALFAE